MNCLVNPPPVDEKGIRLPPLRELAAFSSLSLSSWICKASGSVEDLEVIQEEDTNPSLPPNARTVGSKWLFKKKTDMDGATLEVIRILIAIAAYYDYEIWQMDVKTAFLNGHLSEEVYMEQPEGFVNPKYPNHVCKLKRSIYGLKQASRQWIAD
ncbi:retrotransposon protein, putative, ty1-copia subclass [Tanacetum coccineum]